MSNLQSDVLIIGAGVVGLAIGIALLEASPTLKVTILEKEKSLGSHASGRNSGVLHAGFYYSPDSLKAKFCKDGNSELRKLCREFNVSVQDVGKVVVAQTDADDEKLDDLFTKGITNGVDVELLPASDLIKYEPLAKTRNRFLWSPKTAISNPELVLTAMQAKFNKLGGNIIFNHSAQLSEHHDEIIVRGYPAKLIVNAAGAQSDRLARDLGMAKQYSMVPFMGLYRTTSYSNIPLQRLVYPVPHSVNPFLGVHFTITMNGSVKVGPTAIPILGREQYSMFKGWSFSDVGQAGLATKALISGSAHDFSQILRSEIPKLLHRNLVREGAKLVPIAAQVKDWAKKPPGIRAQLVDRRTGELVQDFVVEKRSNCVHILNAVSPGWTSALPFGRWVAISTLLPLL